MARFGEKYALYRLEEKKVKKRSRKKIIKSNGDIEANLILMDLDNVDPFQTRKNVKHIKKDSILRWELTYLCSCGMHDKREYDFHEPLVCSGCGNTNFYDEDRFDMEYVDKYIIEDENIFKINLYRSKIAVMYYDKESKATFHDGDCVPSKHAMYKYYLRPIVNKVGFIWRKKEQQVLIFVRYGHNNKQRIFDFSLGSGMNFNFDSNFPPFIKEYIYYVLKENMHPKVLKEWRIAVRGRVTWEDIGKLVRLNTRPVLQEAGTPIDFLTFELSNNSRSALKNKNNFKSWIKEILPISSKRTIHLIKEISKKHKALDFYICRMFKNVDKLNEYLERLLASKSGVVESYNTSVGGTQGIVFRDRPYYLNNGGLKKRVSISKIKNFFGSDRFFENAIIETEISKLQEYLVDSYRSLVQIENYLDKAKKTLVKSKYDLLKVQYKELKATSIKELHDVLADFYLSIANENFEIEYTDIEKKTLNFSYSSSLSFKLIVDTHECRRIGRTMRICVGSYSEYAVNKNLYIVTLQNEGEPKVCIELAGNEKEGFQIRQAKLFANHYLRTKDPEEMKYLQAIQQYIKQGNIKIKTHDLHGLAELESMEISNVV